MIKVKLPKWFIDTPLDERVLDYGNMTNQNSHNTEYTDGNKMLKVGTGLINLDELLYLIVQYGHDHHTSLNRFEASTVLWLMMNKDLLHGNRFLPTVIRPSEFIDSIPYAPYHMLAKTVTKTYASNKPTANITKIQPIQAQISNPYKISDKTLRKTYWQPIYDFYVNDCKADFNGTDVILDKNADAYPFTYRPNINCYSLALQAWLNNNLPIAFAIVKTHSTNILDVASIINRYTDYATYNLYTHGPGSIRVIEAKQLNTHPGLTKYKESVRQIIKFLNI